MVLAWMLWSSHSLKEEGDFGFGMDSLVVARIKRRTEFGFGHGCSGNRMLLEHERNYGLGMDALVIALIKR